ncbi:repressor LexA, partial [Stenotrophomonas maltophilia]
MLPCRPGTCSTRILVVILLTMDLTDTQQAILQ